MTHSLDLQQVPTLHERLKKETRDTHVSLESRLDLMHAGYGLHEYGSLLARFYQFHAAFDEFVATRQSMNWASAWFYADGRLKSAWLAEDLAALGVQPHPFSVAMRERLAEMLKTPAHLWGAIYVIEGSMLGGVHISKHFGHALGLARDTGMHYFSGYGQETGRNWHAFLQVLDGMEQSVHADIVMAAIQTFDFLSECLVRK